MPPFIADGCVPVTCTESDLSHIVQTFVTANAWGNMTFTVTSTRCFRGRYIKGDPAALFTASLLVILVCCVGCGTFYDIYLRRSKLRVKHGPELMIGYKKDTKQYGILKVILASPAERKLERRNTIGGYEKSDNYLLSEIKVNRQTLLHEKKAPSVPDVTSGGCGTEDDVTPLNKGTTTLRQDQETVQELKESSPNEQDTAADGQVKERKSDTNNTPETGAGTHSDDETDGCNTDKQIPVSELRSPQRIRSINQDTRTELKNARKLSASDPGRIHTESQQVGVTALATGQLEIDVPESHSMRRSACETRMPEKKTPAKIKHTPAVGRQGSVFERQMSTASDDDPLLDRLGPQRMLTDIPEESSEVNGKENGDILVPEVEIKEKPIIKAASLLRDVILSFSFRRSTKRVMAEGSPDTLFCLNGVRVMSIAWIVLGNVYMTLYLNPDVVDNHVDGVKLTQKLWVQAVINTTLAADSFYVLSGTLGAYNFMKLKKSFKGKKMTEVMTFKEYVLLIFHRLLRIGPCYWLTLLMFTNLMPYMGKGPRWTYEITSVESCKTKWWANALFFSNFYQAHSMCMPHTYYLVNDFQFALLSPLFMIPLLCLPKLGFALLGGLVMLQIVCTLILNQGINGNVLRMSETDYFSKVYVKPYCRIGVYAIGLGLGYILYLTKRQIKFRKIPLVIFWTLSLVLVAILPYITYLENRAGGRQWSGLETAFFEALSRPLWATALAWLIFACSTGHGAFINKLLSWNAFLPLCRITYGVYLLHPMLIAAVISSRHNGFYIDFGELTYEFVANLVVSYLLAFILITFVECPFASLEANVRAHIGQRRKKI